LRGPNLNCNKNGRELHALARSVAVCIGRI
jgi:hypothetical protein